MRSSNTAPEYGLTRIVLLATMALTIWLVATNGGVQAQQYTATSLDGVYTESQAERGHALYDQHCARCHSTSEFSGTMFRVAWVDRPVSALYNQIATTMPMDQPGSLGRQQTAALIAFILSLNDFPSGDRALPEDTESLSSIRISPPD